VWDGKNCGGGFTWAQAATGVKGAQSRGEIEWHCQAGHNSDSFYETLLIFFKNASGVFINRNIPKKNLCFIQEEYMAEKLW